MAVGRSQTLNGWFIWSWWEEPTTNWALNAWFPPSNPHQQVGVRTKETPSQKNSHLFLLSSRRRCLRSELVLQLKLFSVNKQNNWIAADCCAKVVFIMNLLSAGASVSLTQTEMKSSDFHFHQGHRKSTQGWWLFSLSSVQIKNQSMTKSLDTKIRWNLSLLKLLMRLSVQKPTSCFAQGRNRQTELLLH